MSDKKSHILFAVELDGKGAAESLKGENEIAKKLKSPTLAWAHLDVNHPETKTWLKKNLPYLDDIILESLLAEETRPRILEIGNGVLLILRGVNLNPGAEPEDMVSLRIWIDKHRVISTQRRPVKAVENIHEKLKAGTGPKDAADIMVALMTSLFKYMEPVILELDERTDNIEEAILETPDLKDRQDIIDIRKMAIVLRRYIAPQKDVVGYLRLSEIKWLDSLHRRQLQESQDRLSRYVEDLDAIRERAQIVKDELANILSDRMNKNMYVLSVVAAIFLPLGFITGLLGINVGGMPGADDSIAFWIVCLLCGIFVIAEYLLFKFMRWL